MITARSCGLIAIIDVETTGLYPHRHDRVVEMAAVVLDGDGRTIREMVSIVNPGRDMGPSTIHGLTGEDVVHAPRFDEIAGLFVETLQETVAIAGHNVHFDFGFVENEFGRIGSKIPECFSICTMQLAGGGRLPDCCDDYGVPFEGEAHHALADARATARLLAILLSDHPRMIQELRTLVPIRWPTVRSTQKQPITREDSRKRQTETPTYLQRLLGRMHDRLESCSSEEAVMAYMALLDRVLEDRHVSDTDGDALFEMAKKWGLDNEQIRFAHGEYLDQLTTAAVSDGVVTETELRDLRLVARLLGQQKRDWDEQLRRASSKLANVRRVDVTMPASDTDLRGKRVCFTGELQCSYQGELIPRELAEEFATEAGLIVMNSVTKKLDLLVLADPHSQSGKAKKARQYGIRIMHEPVFWKAICIEVE